MLDGNFKLKPGQPQDLNFHRALVQLHLAQDMEKKEENFAEEVAKQMA